MFRKVFIKIFYILLVAMVAGIVVLGYVYIISPRQKDINEGGSVTLQEKSNQLKELEIYLKKVTNMSEEYKNYTGEKIKTLTSILPLEKDIPGLFVQMQELAKQNDFALNSIDISDAGSGRKIGFSENPGEDGAVQEEKKGDQAKAVADDSGGIKELNISFIISGGNYENLKHFLSDIEMNLRLFDVYDINFGSAERGSYSINMRTYYLSK